MGTVNISVEHDGLPISYYLLSYKRTSDLCSGVGTLEVEIDHSYPPAIIQGDTLKLYEDGNLKGTYYVSTIEKNPQRGYFVMAQDNSKYMQAYFLFDLSKTQGLSARYWIGRVLSRAGISYNFTTSETGYNLNPYHDIGLETAYDVVMRLCQQSGWYFYFNAGGTCQIGTLSSGWSNPSLQINTNAGSVLDEFQDSNDDQLRNRVVVYGGQGYNLEISTQTAWDRGQYDKRTVVYSNGYINDLDTAYELGFKILNEYSKTVSVKVYTVAGHVDAAVGDVIRCNTKVFRGTGRISNIVSRTTNNEGFVTELTLDKRCPRLVGYWRIDPGEYVYVGTREHGVYRKALNGTTWSSWNTGLTNLNIRDMKIKNGLFVVTTNTNEIFTRFVDDTSWTDITPIGWTEVIDGTPTDFNVDGYIGRGCAIDEATGQIHAGFYDTTISGSWVGEYNPFDATLEDNGNWSFTQVITDEGKDLVEVLDTDYNSVNKVITARTSVPSEIQRIYEGLNRNVYSEQSDMFATTNAFGYFDPKTVTTGSAYANSIATYIRYISLSSTIHDGYIYQNKLYIVFSSSLYEYDLATDTVTQHTYTSIGTAFYSREVYTPDGNTFYIINDNKLHKYVISTDTITEIDSQIFPYTAESTQAQYLLYERYYYILEDYNATNRTFTMYKYDLVQADIVDSITTPGLLDDGHTIVWSRSELMTVTDTSAHIVSCAVVGGGGQDTLLRYTIGTIYHEIGTPFTSDGTWYTWTDTEDSNPFGNGSVTAIKLASNDRLGNVVMAISGYLRNNQVTWVGYYYTFFLFLPDITTTSKKYAFTKGNPFQGEGWYPYLNDGVSSDPQFVTTFRTVTMRGEFFTRVKDGTSASPTWYLRDITGTLKTDIDSNFSLSAVEMNQVGDDYDNTLITVNGSGDLEFIDKYGNLVKTYDCTTAMSDSYGTRFSVPIGESTGVFLGGRHNGSIVVYTISGVAMPPSVTGVVAATDKFITTSGDTFGVIGTFITSGNMYVECSQSSPALFFGGDLQTGESYISETLNSGDLTAQPISWYLDGATNSPITTVMDMRSVGMLGPVYDKLVYEVGAPRTVKDYLFAVTQSGILVRQLDSSLDYWNVYDSTATPMHRMETSNPTYQNPYFFFSTSGAPSTFYQQDPNETSFTEYSTGLPASNITVIRLDDRI